MNGSKTVLISGGAGFIGSNAAADFLQRGWEVVAFDNLSRSGTEGNLRWLRSRPGSGRLRFVRADLTDPRGMRRLVAGLGRVDAVLHLGGQVAVTTAMQDPRGDCLANVEGTLNLLEAVRAHGANPAFVFPSSNKVYGPLAGLRLRRTPTRWEVVGLPHGIPESTPLDPCSPYACSKAAAEAYVRDYARLYGMNTVVLRQSTIYGPHQLASEEQGWLSWFIASARSGRIITIFGDGRQVRDLLHISDLLAAYRSAIARIRRVRGRVFNIGGGPRSTLSLLECLNVLIGPEPTGRIRFMPPRPGDQRYFVSDIRAAARTLRWRPRPARAALFPVDLAGLGNDESTRRTREPASRS